MNTMNTIYTHLNECLLSPSKVTFNDSIKFMGRIIEEVQDHTVGNSKRNETLLTISNIFFLIVIDYFAHRLEEEAFKDSQKMTPLEAQLIHFVIDFQFVGGAIFLLNALFNRLSRHPIGKIKLIAISIAAIMVRKFFNQSQIDSQSSNFLQKQEQALHE